MKRKFTKKIISSVVCAALIVGGIPATAAKKAKADNPSELLVEGKIDGSGTSIKVELKVDDDRLADSSKGSYTFNWLVSTTEAGLSSAQGVSEGEKGKKYELTGTELDANGNAFIQVVGKSSDSSLPEVKSRVLKVTSFELQVDLLDGVDTEDVSVTGASDGKIEVKGSNIDVYKGPDVNSGKFTSGKAYKSLQAGQYRVSYNNASASVLKNGLYAVYEIKVKAGGGTTPATSTTPSTPPVTAPATATPSVTAPATAPPVATAPATAPPVTVTPAPTAPSAPTSPSATPVPEETVGPTVEPATPTPTPGFTQAPATSAPTPAPTEEPTMKPTAAPPAEETEEPTQAPITPEEPTDEPEEPIEEPEEVDMEEAGTKTVVGKAVYKSTGDGTVSFTKSTDMSQKSVSIPAAVTVNGKKYPVTKIEKNAFRGSKVQSVKIGSNVKEIGAGTFKNCKKLKKVTFPNKLKTLGNGAFAGCTKLASASLPSSVKKVGDKAFKNCKSLKKFTIGKKPVKTKKGKVMFGGPATKISIGANAMENCVALRRVIINSQVTKIGNSTFKNCKKLAEILVRSLMLKKVGGKALTGVNNCKIGVPTVRLKKYRTLFKNKGQGKKVVIAKV